METYGNNDWRDYLAHYGTPRHSGRYPWGSGKNPRQGTVRYYGTVKTFVEASSKNKIKHPGVKVINNDSPKVAYKKSDSSKISIKKKAQALTPEQDAKLVNPTKCMTNCMLCTVAFEMRRRGYDVTAKNTTEGRFDKWNYQMFPKTKLQEHEARSWEEFDKIQKGAATIRGNIDLEKRVAKTLKKEGTGARGNLMLTFRDGGGHSVAYEVTKKGYKIYDTQLGKEYSERMSSWVVKHTVGVTHCRFDNVDFNEEKIFEAIQNRK